MQAAGLSAQTRAMNDRRPGSTSPPTLPLRGAGAPPTDAASRSLAALPALLASAPHRLLFFAGASAVIVSMLWWACVLGAGRLGHAMPAPPVPAGWAHAVFTQYGMLAPFIFGFLLTVFPRWMAQPALPRRAYVPVFAGVFGGYLLAHAGLLGSKPLLLAGIAAMFAGWLAGLFALGGVLARGRTIDRHALSCLVALVLGACGLAAFGAFALGAPWQFAYVSIRVGTFAFLLPVYFTVCHRMVPFFSASVAGPRYRAFKPGWSLPLLWTLLLAHLVLDLGHHQDLQWFVDAPLAAFFLVHAIGWQPWRCLRPGLLAALHLAFAWLPLAFALYAAQGFLAWTDHGFLFARAPAHALTVGYFGSMLVAMVTRVTQGHSGRPLQMGRIAWLTFGLLQLVVLLRLYAEVANDAPRWLAIAAAAWVLAFAPWVARSLWIFLTPRVDGQPG